MGERGQPPLTARGPIRALRTLALAAVLALAGPWVPPAVSASADAVRVTTSVPSSGDPAAPLLAFSAPAPGTSVSAGTRYRFGWREPSDGSPVIDRAVTLLVAEPTRGGCRDARYDVAWTRPAARPGGATLTGLPPASCLRLRVLVTRVDGTRLTAVSGSVRTASPAGAGGPVPEFVSPGAGEPTLVPTIGLTFARWTETGGGPVVDRTLVEERADPVTPGDCTTAAGWTPTRVLAPATAVHALAGLWPGRCYRYAITLRDAEGRTGTARSGSFLASARPPACGYGGIVGSADPEDGWARIVLDPAVGLPPGYVPPDLVAATTGSGSGRTSARVRALVLPDLRAMFAAAAAAGAPLRITSAYRGFAEQTAVFADRVARLGLAEALTIAARPGHSEHQLGTVIDLTSARGTSVPAEAWGSTPAGAWVGANAWRYGFVLSYPGGGSASSCYRPEPWHVRYVGRALAAQVHTSGLTLREYLWRHRALAPLD